MTFKERLQHEPSHVIVLDLQLGGTDGVEQFRYLAKCQCKGQLILMSGFDARVLATTCVLAKSLDLDIVAGLAKPIRVEEMEHVLRQLGSAGTNDPRRSGRWRRS